MKIARLLFEELDEKVDPEWLARVDLPPAESLRTLASERDARLLEWRKRDVASDG